MTRNIWVVFVWANETNFVAQWTPVKGFLHEADAREDASCRLLPTHVARVRVQLPGSPAQKRRAR